VLRLHKCNRQSGSLGCFVSLSGARSSALAKLPRRNPGSLPSERSPYIKLVNAKPNFTPRSTESPWYELRNIELPNPEPPIYPHGDRVQAVARVTLPFKSSAVAASS
jgi:hypothetical protein